MAVLIKMAQYPGTDGGGNSCTGRGTASLCQESGKYHAFRERLMHKIHVLNMYKYIYKEMVGVGIAGRIDVPVFHWFGGQ